MTNSKDYQWFKGNTHSHTTKSDGDSDPDVAAAWYQSHGYNFLAITDHDFYTDINEVSYQQGDDFILLPGNEISARAEGKPIHINALNIREHLPQQQASTIVEALQKGIDAIRDVGGVPQINHPNFRWSFSYQEISQVRNCNLFEVYNGSTQTNNFSGGGYLGHDEIWDRVLSSGKRLYGIADDDTHHFTGEFNMQRDNPGRGWVMVRASRLEPEAIVQALDHGDFYASTEIILKKYEVSNKEISIQIEQERDYGYTTVFIGRDGKVLKRVYGTEPHYEFDGSELYVRGKIFSTNGGWAWTQPVFIEDL